MIIDREELAWATGFFDGEGSTLLNKKFQVNLALSQSGEEALPILERFDRATGSLGKINGPYTARGGQYKPVYHWNAYGFEKSQAVIAMMWPWLTDPKRQQASPRLTGHIQHMSFGYRNGTHCLNGHKIAAGDRDARGRIRCRWCSRADMKKRNDRNRVVPYRPRPSRRKEGMALNDA